MFVSTSSWIAPRLGWVPEVLLASRAFFLRTRDPPRLEVASTHSLFSFTQRPHGGWPPDASLTTGQYAGTTTARQGRRSGTAAGDGGTPPKLPRVVCGAPNSQWHGRGLTDRNGSCGRDSRCRPSRRAFAPCLCRPWLPRRRHDEKSGHWAERESRSREVAHFGLPPPRRLKCYCRVR